MYIIVYEYNESNNEGNKVKSKYVICPEFKENIFINIRDYRINLSIYMNNHIKNNILLEEYEQTQKIDLSKIKCDNIF